MTLYQHWSRWKNQAPYGRDSNWDYFREFFSTPREIRYQSTDKMAKGALAWSASLPVGKTILGPYWASIKVRQIRSGK